MYIYVYVDICTYACIFTHVGMHVFIYVKMWCWGDVKLQTPDLPGSTEIRNHNEVWDLLETRLAEMCCLVLPRGAAVWK